MPWAAARAACADNDCARPHAYLARDNGVEAENAAPVTDTGVCDQFCLYRRSFVWK